MMLDQLHLQLVVAGKFLHLATIVVMCVVQVAFSHGQRSLDRVASCMIPPISAFVSFDLVRVAIRPIGWYGTIM